MVKYTRMEENKRVYDAQYDTDEYESLTCECHHLGRAKELNGSRRKPFFCIHCKMVYKDKNKLNLHRLEGCFAVTGDGRKTVLKIYPVFGKGQRGEIEDILIKHGLMNPRKKPSRAKRKKDQWQSSPPHKKHMQISSHGDTLQVQMQLTREQVEAQAREVASLMTPLDVAVNAASSPQAVPCPGLWHLMQFQLLPSDFPDVEDHSFLQAFVEFVDHGLVDPGLRSAYGTWYMEREADASEEEQSAVKLTMSRFKLSSGRPDLLLRQRETTALQAFLQFQRDWLHYESQKDAAQRELQLRRENYVKDRLEDFDARNWNWSPLLHLLKSDSIPVVLPRPWSHSDSEQKKFSQALQMNRIKNPPHCPLIVRVFKVVYLFCFEKSSVLSDPIAGLSWERMMGYTNDPVLQISAQSVLNEGCFLFANMPPHSEAQAEMFQDINLLLHGSEAEKVRVLQKVQEFLKSVRQRAAADMATLYPEAFRVLWRGGAEAQVDDAVKKFSTCLQSREDLDMGWVPFPAVMQAREAVVTAIHKLHDERVQSDRLRLQTTDHEKFQALVETCAEKLPNGSQDLERRSSYSTTSESAEVEQDSPSSHEMDLRSSHEMDLRSSHEMKDTDIDVERPSSRKPSPDLNLNLDSNDPGSPAPTPTVHMAELHVAKPGAAPAKIHGVEVPMPPHHFYGSGGDDPSNSRASVQSLVSGNHSYAVPLLFNSQSSFSTTSTANTYSESLRDSSATPVVTRKDE